MVFFNGYLLHRSRKNRGSIYRRVLVNHYCNAWSLLPWSLQGRRAVATADRRCIIPVAGIDPYAWKGYEHAAAERLAAHLQGEPSRPRRTGIRSLMRRHGRLES